jgi:peroxiredoxin
MHKLNILVLLILTFSLSLQAQNKRVENFSLPDAKSGKTISLNDYGNHKAVVVLFTNNHCPYSRLYEERFRALVKEYGGKDVAFLIINPNDPRESKDDSMEAMQEKARKWGVDIPYLTDQQQQVAKMFGASKTPEVFVLSNTPNHFTIVYSGALDDNPQVAEDVRQHYAKQALDAVLQGKAVSTPHKRPVGCMIKVRN